MTRVAVGAAGIREVTPMAHPVNRMALDLSHHNTIRDFQAIVDGLLSQLLPTAP
jgi:hypothetical protein